MAANFLHGVETIEVSRGARPINVVKSAVIGIVGCAPTGPVNSPTLLLSDRDAAVFGPEVRGWYSLTEALTTIYGYGNVTVIAVNVLDPAIHRTQEPSATLTFSADNDRGMLRGGLSNLVLTYEGKALKEGKDYEANLLTGHCQRLPNGSIPVGATVNASYYYADYKKVDSSDIIGKVEASGRRTGLQLLADTYNDFGFCAKILVIPSYTNYTPNAQALQAMASKIGAVAYIDAPTGTLFSDALKGRGPSGINNFNTSHPRTMLCYPNVKMAHRVSGGVTLSPLSTHAAALRATVDQNEGFWYSTSNHELVGVLGLERPLSARIDDPQSEVNLLNEKGITTVFSSYGTGLRLWGNRTAAFPIEADMKTFEAVRRTADIINESIRYASLPFIDKPLTPALFTSIIESVNAFGRKLEGDGAVLGFKAWMNKDRNPPIELSKGHLLVSYKFTPPPALERLSYESEITDEYLVKITSLGE
ncbi:phage tail sheath subtilisin-like domain-containing protein [Sapientia aquatica]|uniref:Phage tail sheath family protein n=1 Tax=Sapientia aquatica TaxID=1549640 RepID=A0A4R5W3I2_9BURK|nr:phage tail sheath subtilisin-like domain-containing protein [Sapientia aquatica]TDK65978.1 phage tail sheath family protein [Sapientia aquatica]